jgi:hypothetical protein
VVPANLDLIRWDLPKGGRQSRERNRHHPVKVGSDGEVGDIRPLRGEESASVPMLMSSLAKWKFAPALNGTAPMPATGKVLLIKSGTAAPGTGRDACWNQTHYRLPHQQRPRAFTQPCRPISYCS